jgi:ATP-dependent DNA helicase RecG
MITSAELKQLILQGETDRLELTVSKTNDEKFGQAVCAFANDLPNSGLPGYLVIGINDQLQPTGVQIDDKLLQLLGAIRSDGLLLPPPSIQVAKLQIDGHDVAVVEVQPGHVPPYQFKGNVWIRIGPRKGKAVEADERFLSEKRSSLAHISYDASPCLGTTIDDLKLDSFYLNYLPRAVDKEIIEENHRDKKIQLSSLGFFDLKNDCPTYAGIIFFGINPLFWMPGAYIQYVKFAGLSLETDVIEENIFSGDLVTMLGTLESFLKAQTPITPKSKGGLQEEYYIPYPINAIRELMLNAIMHRDYRSNAPIRLFFFQDRIEILSPGGLFGNANPENFPNQTAYRNPRVAKGLKDLVYVNQFGMGVIRAKVLLEKNGNPEPVFIIHQQGHFGIKIFKKHE